MTGEVSRVKKADPFLARAGTTLALLAGATAFSLLINAAGIGKECVIMVFLLGVLFTTVLTHGYSYGVVSSLVSVLLFNFLFTEPKYTFLIHSPSDVVLLVFFEVTAIVSGSVMSRMRTLMEASGQNERTTQLLYQIATGFLNCTGEKNILQQGIVYIREYAGRGCYVTLEGAQDAQPEERPARAYSIPSAMGILGTLHVLETDEPPGDRDELVIKTVATQMGIALDREFVYHERENIRVAMERERLRSTLLRSVAHDLRSPLTALSGASTLLADDYERLSDQEKKQLAGDISEEMVWLSNLVENILNMTRINESRLELHLEDEVVDDVVGEAVSHMNRLLRTRRFKARLPDEVLMAPMDGKLIVQVLVNLLDNAVKHTPSDSEIELSVAKAGGEIEFCVADTGDGIDESVRDSLFEGFVTSDHGRSDSKRGMGLGLAICKAVVEAHRGEIHMEENRPKGSRFIFTLPMEDAYAGGL